MHKNKLILIIALILLVLPTLTSAFTGTSASYVLNTSTFGFFAANATSPSYASHTHGNNLIVGNATSPSYANELGYIHTVAAAAGLAAADPVIAFAYTLARAVDFNTLFILRANVTDTNNNIQSVNFSVKNASGSYVLLDSTGTSAGTTLYNSTAVTANEYGTWTGYVNATDTTGLKNYTTFTFKVGLATKTVYPREQNLSSFALWLTNSLGKFNLSFIAPDSIGIYSFKVNATVSALYGESTQSLMVTANPGPPTITIINPTNSTNLSRGTSWTWINITTNENATCQYNYTNDFTYGTNGTDFTTANNTFHYFNFSNGTAGLKNGAAYILYYRCNDTTAEVGSTLHMFSVLPNNVPTAPILSAPASGNLTTLRSFTLHWNNATDEDIESINYTLQINSSSGVILETNITETANRTNYTLVEGQFDTDIIYYWKVRAYDSADYSSWSDTWNFTIESELLVSLPTSLINFGTLLPGQTANSSSANTPIIIQNAGNILMNVTITGTSIWSSQPNPTSYYKYWLQANETGSYAYANTTDRNMMTSSSVIDIRNLNYSDANDDARLQVFIQAPANEPAGSKNSAITITATG